MKKYNFLMIGLLFTSSVSFAQQKRMISSEVSIKPAPVTSEEMKMNTIISNSVKAEGDTLWYEDFGNGLSTNGWVSTDPNSNGFDWIYTTAAPGGQYSTGITAINSVTAANGFISLPSDLYNTPTPGSGFANISSFITSGPITVNPVGNVLLRFRQSVRYCCNAATALLNVQVSNDNINWVSYNAKGNAAVNASLTENKEINISPQAAGQSTIYLRFVQDATHYYWMIDDIAIVEGAPHQIVVTDGFSSFGTEENEGFYTITPAALTQPLTFSLEIQNDGGFDATNVGILNSIESSVQGNVYLDSSVRVPVITSPLGIETLTIPRAFANTSGNGDYVATLTASADSVSSDPSKEVYTYEWAVADTVFARDYNINGGNIGPGSYQGGDIDGSRLGTRFTLKDPQVVTSVSYFISTATANIGAEMRSQVWGYDSSQATLNDALNIPGVKALNPIPYIIQASDLGTWLTIPMLPPVSLPAGQYAVVAEQSAGNLNVPQLQLGFGRDRTSEEFQFFENYSTLLYTNGGTPSWGWIAAQPMMRMNFGQLAIGVEEAAKAIEGFTVAPNPNNGQFNVVVTAQKANFDLSVSNMVGQIVYNEQIAVNNTLTKNIDLSNLNKGIYFVSIENGVNRKVQKVIIK